MEIFEESNLGGIKINNRIIRSSTHEGLSSSEGLPTLELTKKYTELAKGGVGAIITGYAGIMKNGKSSLKNMLMIDTDDKIDEFKKLTKEVKKYGSAIILQIAHCGRQTDSNTTGFIKVAPSAIRDKYYKESVPKELEDEEIEEIINNFVNAIVRAKSSGFDGVQLHCAHGYLLSSFLSPYMNKRNDKWGGSLENRYRIIGKIFSKARSKVGDYPIFVKINGSDFSNNGNNIKDVIETAKLLEKSGCSGIEVSCGIVEDGFNTSRCSNIPIKAILKFSHPFNLYNIFIKKIVSLIAPLIIKTYKPINNYNVEAAGQIKKNVKIPIIAVGGIRNFEYMNEIITKEVVDYISMSRPFIIEPNIVEKFRDKKQADSKCIECNYCLLAVEKVPVKCFYGKIPKTQLI